MTGSEIAIIWVAIVYWIVDMIRMLRTPSNKGVNLFIAGIRLTLYAGFIIWFIAGHWN